MAKQPGSSGKARPNKGMSSSARSNAGGAVRGQARAAAVKAMKPKRKAPVSVTRSGRTSTITGSRSADAQAIRRGRLNQAKPKAASVGAPSAAKKPEFQDYAGKPGDFLKDFLSGGALRKR